MGLLAMSLINRMLQELDGRRSEVTGSGPLGQQIRPVHASRRIHPAWWGVLVLSCVLAGFFVWGALRPAPTAQDPGKQLPLKLDIDLSVAPAEGLRPNMPPPTDAAADMPSAEPETNQTASEPVRAVKPPLTPGLPEGMPPPMRGSARKLAADKVEAPAAVEKEMSAATVPDLNKTVQTVKTLPPPTVTRQAEPSTSAVFNKQVKELSPQQRAENEYRKSLQLMQQGKTAESINGFEEALRLDPQNVDARHALIGALLTSKRQDDALRKAAEGLEINPAQPGLAMILARLQLEKGELKLAIESLERTLRYAVEQPDYQAFLAALLQRDERHRQAIEHYLLALQKSPQNGVWWMGVGISFQADQRLPEAKEAFRRAKATNNLPSELLAFVEGRLSQLQR